MLVFDTIKSLQQHLSSLPIKSLIGFVPTMGALHRGHLSLIEEAKKNNSFVVVSIFVNPTQFNNPTDLDNYPRTLESDLALLKAIGCNAVFTPNSSEIYGKYSSSKFNFDGIENQMEGKFRAGHFDGVGSVVKRLFEIVKPTNAYFGEKDFQQLLIIRKLVFQCNIPVTIHGCTIYREKDGLAMSSRNMRLTQVQRKSVPFIYQTLKKVKLLFNTLPILKINELVESEFNDKNLFSLEYFQIADEDTLQQISTKQPNKKCRAFIAVNVGDIRLIDNISL